jgi:hypothetical protein
VVSIAAGLMRNWHFIAGRVRRIARCLTRFADAGVAFDVVVIDRILQYAVGLQITADARRAVVPDDQIGVAVLIQIDGFGIDCLKIRGFDDRRIRKRAITSL